MQTSETITIKSASNLALAFVLLPKEKRRGMSALYAFCREVDDVADEDSVPVEIRRERLQWWREDLRRAFEGRAPRFAVNAELQPVIARYRLAAKHFEEILDGVEMDLETREYATYSELEEYCYRVASAVGLLSIEVFGYRDPAAREYAVFLGKALQLTNILRDVSGDADRGRIYIPREEMQRHRLAPEEILRKEYSDRFRQVAAAVAGRAKGYYLQARQSLPAVDRKAMIAAELMGSVYWKLLRRIEGRGFDVFGGAPVRLGKPLKLALIARTWCRLALGARTPNYG